MPAMTGKAQHSQPSTPASIRLSVRASAALSTTRSRVPQNGHRIPSRSVTCMTGPGQAPFANPLLSAAVAASRSTMVSPCAPTSDRR